jgi:hypothetical protein
LDVKDVMILAYVGPGPGLTMFWAFLALLGTICLAVLSLLALPFRILIRRLRGTPAQPPHANDSVTGDGGNPH